MTTRTSQTIPLASQATPAASTGPTLVPTDAPAINDQPVELDASASVTPEEVSRRRRGSEMGTGGRRGSEKRDEMVAQRKGDPGVIVDVPGGLTAEEVEAVGKVVR